MRLPELLEASASTARVEDFALRLAQRRGLSNLGPLALVVREQPTVRQAIEVLIQYIGLHSDALCPCLEEKDRVVTISRMLSGKRVRTRQALELSVAMLFRIMKTLLRDAWRPEEVCFIHGAPTHPELHRHFFGTGAIFLGLRWNRLQGRRSRQVDTSVRPSHGAVPKRTF
jgi:hypothetical protein